MVRSELAELVSGYGRAASASLSSAVIAGEPEAQLRSPIRSRLDGLAPIAGCAGSLPITDERKTAATALKIRVAKARANETQGELI